MLNSKVSCPISLGGEEIKTLGEFCYLGSISSTDEGVDKDISQDWKGQACFSGPTTSVPSQNNSLLTPSWKYSTQTWNPLFCMVVRPGVQPRFFTKSFKSLWIGFLQSILGIQLPNKMSNEEPRWEKLWRWIGHTLRRESTKVQNSSLRQDKVIKTGWLLYNTWWPGPHNWFLPLV